MLQRSKENLIRSLALSRLMDARSSLRQNLGLGQRGRGRGTRIRYNGFLLRLEDLQTTPSSSSKTTHGWGKLERVSKGNKVSRLRQKCWWVGLTFKTIRFVQLHTHLKQELKNTMKVLSISHFLTLVLMRNYDVGKFVCMWEQQIELFKAAQRVYVKISIFSFIWRNIGFLLGGIV